MRPGITELLRRRADLGRGGRGNSLRLGIGGAFTSRAGGAVTSRLAATAPEARSGRFPRGLPGCADAAELRHAGRLRLLAVRLRSRAGAAAGRTALLLHPARHLLGAVGGRRGARRGGLRPARAPAAARRAAVVLGGRCHRRRRPVRRLPHRRIHHARRRGARLRRHHRAHLHPGDPVRPARRTPRPGADRSQRRRRRLRGARPAPARPVPEHPRRLAGGHGPARPRARRPVPALPAPAPARGARRPARRRPGQAAAVLLAAGHPGRRRHRGRVLPDLLRRRTAHRDRAAHRPGRRCHERFLPRHPGRPSRRGVAHPPRRADRPAAVRFPGHHRRRVPGLLAGRNACPGNRRALRLRPRHRQPLPSLTRPHSGRRARKRRHRQRPHPATRRRARHRRPVPARESRRPPRTSYRIHDRASAHRGPRSCSWPESGSGGVRFGQLSQFGQLNGRREPQRAPR